MQFRIYKILMGREGLYCFLCLLIQQIIVASSTVWLARLVQDIHANYPIWNNLGLYLLSLTLPYVPGGIALIFAAKWKQRSLGHLIEKFTKFNQKQISAWSQRQEREEKIAYLTSEGQSTLSDSIGYLYDLSSCALNVLFNITVLSFVVEPKYVLGYGLSLILVALLLKLQSKKQGALATRAQESRVKLGQSLLSAWDNVLIGNIYNLKLWWNKTFRNFSRAEKDNIRSETFRQSVSIAIALLTLLPTIVILITSLVQNMDNKVMLSTFVVTLPRLFMILGFTHEILWLLSQWTTHKNRLRGLHNSIFSTPIFDLASRIQWNKLRLHVQDKVTELKSIDDMHRTLPKAGRITLRGENGSGKSTLLMLLKDQWGEKAYYLPAQHHLEFESAQGLSTGELLRARLKELSEKVNTDILLLDEWDSNLDHSNQQELSHLIDQLSEKKCIIEIRHRV